MRGVLLQECRKPCRTNTRALYWKSAQHLRCEFKVSHLPPIYSPALAHSQSCVSVTAQLIRVPFNLQPKAVAQSPPLARSSSRSVHYRRQIIRGDFASVSSANTPGLGTQLPASPVHLGRTQRTHTTQSGALCHTRSAATAKAPVISAAAAAAAAADSLFFATPGATSTDFAAVGSAACAAPAAMSQRLATLATCNLNQWALDFEGNLMRIKESIVQAKQQGATYRVGPELEVCGYGCEDHFAELDTEAHCWEAMAELMAAEGGDLCKDILCDVGMPVMHRGVLYNCRVIIYNGKILLIRPKLYLANDGNYRETRYFAGWKHPGIVEDHLLPPVIKALGAQSSAPFGDGVLQLADSILAAETCEELFTPNSPHIGLALAGVEIISNGSGSHHQLRKLNTRLDLILGATAKAGGVYLYANQQGCDGGRLYYDGCACVAVNGSLVAQATQFSLRDVEVVTATVDLDAVVSYRSAVSSLREQASSTRAPAAISAQHVHLARTQAHGGLPSPSMQPRFHAPEEEIAYGPAAWLWDYLRRSGAGGYLLPLSGGADSSSTAAIVGAMCQMIVSGVAEGDTQVESDARRIAGILPGVPLTDPKVLAYRLLTTVYLGTVNSSKETRERSRTLAQQVGAYHLELDVDYVVEALLSAFAVLMGRRPRFTAHGGSREENLALQNIQARLRMVTAFLLAQLVPWVRGLMPGGRAAPPPPPARAHAPGALPVSEATGGEGADGNRGIGRTGSFSSGSRSNAGGSFLLVLGSANVDECLRGYLTKYDCSSADVNPIGAISKQDLRRFLKWGAQPAPKGLGYPVLAHVEAAPPTAELEPIVEGAKQQNDEDDMGCTYAELSLFGRLRKMARAGPVSMYRAALGHWQGTLSPTAVAEKVKHFFRFYSINRHKATVLTPSYHAESYSPDDNRYDHRPFLYNVRWPWQFARIDALAAQATQAQQAAAAAGASPTDGAGQVGLSEADDDASGSAQLGAAGGCKQ